MLTKKTPTHKKKKTKTTKRKTQTTYDYIILGGGIAGLYTLYKLSKKYPTKSFILLEKSERFGGRVHSVQLHPNTNDPENILEAGAGRFAESHTRLQELIREFGLQSNVKPAFANAEYVPIEKNTPTQDSLTPIKEEHNTSDYIAKIIHSSKSESREYLQKRNFTDYAKTILSPQEVEHIHDSFGYYSELVIMNAYDAIQLMQQLLPTNKFYVLFGGLSQIIQHLVERIKKNPNTKLVLKQEVIDILSKQTQTTTQTKPTYQIQTKTDRFLARNVICALPKPNLENLSIFKPIQSTLSKILCGKLCRIYTRFPTNDDIWFKDLHKMTTNNNLRMIIPGNVKKGIIMISYSDNKYADFWYKLYQKNSTELIKELRKEIQQTTGKIIPDPIEIHVFYWSCGVGYWGLNANSTEISQNMIQPLAKHPNIYCCGEHFSERNQQWMEGALETSQKVMDRIATQNLN